MSTLVTALLVLEGAGLEGDSPGATDATVVPAKLERLLPGSLRRRAVATATATNTTMWSLRLLNPFVVPMLMLRCTI